MNNTTLSLHALRTAHGSPSAPLTRRHLIVAQVMACLFTVAACASLLFGIYGSALLFGIAACLAYYLIIEVVYDMRARARGARR
jgi:hypothetical protein